MHLLRLEICRLLLPFLRHHSTKTISRMKRTPRNSRSTCPLLPIIAHNEKQKKAATRFPKTSRNNKMCMKLPPRRVLSLLSTFPYRPIPPKTDRPAPIPPTAASSRTFWRTSFPRRLMPLPPILCTSAATVRWKYPSTTTPATCSPWRPTIGPLSTSITPTTGDTRRVRRAGPAPPVSASSMVSRTTSASSPSSKCSNCPRV